MADELTDDDFLTAVEVSVYDWRDPDWSDKNRIHNWKNYITTALKLEWHTFTDRQKQMICHMADEMADREDWD